MSEPDAAPEEEAPSEHLSDEEIESVAELKASSARVVHEVIRLQGHEELKRPLLSLLFSAFAAGLAISTSILAESFLMLKLPRGAAYDLVSGFGYCVGFIMVILGNLQLFTENTVTAVLPLATHPNGRNLARLARLWAIVLAGNFAGTFMAALLVSRALIVSPEQLEAAVTLSSHLLQHDAMRTIWLGIPAGFLVGSIAWILPSARGSEFWIVLVITYVIAIGGFSHVVAGSGEAWLLWLTGRASLGWALGGFIGPALVGNIIGGSGLFAVLAHGQVRGEI